MKKLRDLYKETSKISFVVYIVLRLLVIICMVRELMQGNIENALLCVLSLILFLLPVFIEKTFKIDLDVYKRQDVNHIYHNVAQ